jgi:hypothetical protein
MALKLSSLKPIEGASPDPVGDDESVLVLVKLVKDASPPPYLTIRQRFGADLVSADVSGRDLARLGEDPHVLSFERSQRMSIIR